MGATETRRRLDDYFAMVEIGPHNFISNLLELVQHWPHIRLTNGTHKIPEGMKVGDCSPSCYRCQIDRLIRCYEKTV